MFQIAATTALAEKKNLACCFPNYLQHLDYMNSRWSLQYNKQMSQNFINNAKEYKSFMNIDYTTSFPKHQIMMYNYPFHYVDFIPKNNEFAVDGYFQSEKYFANIRGKILNTFMLSEEQEHNMLDKYKGIIKQKTVSIHIRRGDYLRYTQNHPILPIDYYEKALLKVGDYERCLVFSDDIKRAKKIRAFKNFDVKFITNEPEYIDLFLMSLCNDNAIANSSFSWWGAWLNKNNNKNVYYPETWFGPSKNEFDIKDLIPKDWIKVESRAKKNKIFRF